MKKFRPLWSYDVSKTEEWLSAMAAKGYLFEKMNRTTRCFYFVKAAPKLLTYRFSYDKLQGAGLSKTLVAESWNKVFASGKWSVMCNEKSAKEIKVFTARDAVMKRNSYHFYAFLGIVAFFTGLLVNNLLLIGFSSGGEVVESPFWIITYTLLSLCIAIYLLSIFSMFKIYGSNKLLNERQEANTLEKALKYKWKPQGEIVKKRKMAWMYGPDKLENWLEQMEQQGFNLYRVNRIGTVFYFIKGVPRKVSYCADYQTLSDESYVAIHQDAGWKKVFGSFGSLQKWTIWSREYGEGEQKPQLYSDRTHILNHARKIAITYTCMFLPAIILYLYNVGVKVFLVGTITIWTSFLFLLCLSAFCSFTVRTWLYYWRLKQQLV